MTASLLIIDDDEGIRESLAAYLEDNGYRIREASDGKEGMALVSAEQPDLVLLVPV